MKQFLTGKNITAIAILIVLILASGRLARNGFDSSSFIVAGADFVDPAHTPAPVIVHQGQGYDGQFFYRYAINPFNFEKTAYGITVDHPAYRAQRIGYPFTAWVLSFGGRPQLVPWALLLANLIAFAGIFFYTGKLINLVNGDPRQGLLPLLLFGLYMSLSRDLAEVVELFFFTASVYYLFASRYMMLSVCSALMLLTRETSVISLLPMTACLLVRRPAGTSRPIIFLCIAAPLLVLAAWKLFLHYEAPVDESMLANYGSYGLPFKGIVDGFRENCNFSGSIKVAQFLFWLAYLVWYVLLAATVLTKISFRRLGALDNVSILKISFLVWLLFAICFSDNIWGDDWGFVRVFSMWGMIGFLLLIAEHKRTSALFNIYSGLLLLATVARLIWRV
jgi:hypothetical protein